LHAGVAGGCPRPGGAEIHLSFFCLVAKYFLPSTPIRLAGFAFSPVTPDGEPALSRALLMVDSWATLQPDRDGRP
jgi:hypothetical protein